jgi:DeoR family transcriptional regulator, suf operon transcriptional repressor
MSVETPNSDADLLDLIRIAGPLSVTELADAMEVTATAVRQRLTRLMAQAMIHREAIRAGRGRPKHRYSLTDKGLRDTGSNFTDLALALWREIRAVGDENLGRDVLRRISRALASGYASQIQGETAEARLQSLGELLKQRRIPVTVGTTKDNQSSLTTHACPYPNLAESDRGICEMEKLLFSELIGSDLVLTQCRLNGGGDCRFETGSQSITPSASENGSGQE